MEQHSEHAFRRHYRQVYGFVRRRTATAEQAEDITADVFVSAVAALERLDRDGPPVVAWLYTVARRRLADEARRRARTLALAPPEPPPAYGVDVARAIRRGLALLPEPNRAVVVAKLIEGRAFAEIAAGLGISEGACKMRCARGIARLRDYLVDEGVEP